jgi:dextranase
MGIDGANWNEPTTLAPTPFTDMSVNITVSRAVANVWFASPDGEATMNPTILAYTVEDGVLRFTLPSLEFWSMIVVEYASGS